MQGVSGCVAVGACGGGPVSAVRLTASVDAIEWDDRSETQLAIVARWPEYSCGTDPASRALRVWPTVGFPELGFWVPVNGCLIDQAGAPVVADPDVWEHSEVQA